MGSGQYEVLGRDHWRQQDEHLHSRRELLEEKRDLEGAHGDFGEAMDGGGKRRIDS
jgi:hypothetical protein